MMSGGFKSRKTSRWRNRALRYASLLSLSIATCAHAQVTTTTSVSGQYEVNSNVYELAPGQTVPGTTDTRHSDNYYAVAGSFLGSWLVSRQQFFAQLNGDDERYDHFTQLNHTDYKIDAGWTGRFTDAFNGSVDADRSRSTSPFINAAEGSFAYLTEQRETALLGYQFGANFRLDATGYYATDDTPFPNAPDLRLTQSSGTVAFRFLGQAGFSAGLKFGYLKADFQGGEQLDLENQDVSYDQSTLSLISSYKASGRSQFTGGIGYSRQTSVSKFNSYSGGTGHLDYRYDLSPKTSLGFTVDRTITSSAADNGVGTVLQSNDTRITGSEVDTDGTVNISWEPIRKLDVGLAYTYTNAKYPDQGYTPGSNQTNHVQYASIKLRYRPLIWLEIAPYAKYLTRSSTFIDGDFNSSIFGIFVIGRFQRPQNAGNQVGGPAAL